MKYNIIESQPPGQTRNNSNCFLARKTHLDASSPMFSGVQCRYLHVVALLRIRPSCSKPYSNDDSQVHSSWMVLFGNHFHGCDNRVRLHFTVRFPRAGGFRVSIHSTCGFPGVMGKFHVYFRLRLMGIINITCSSFDDCSYPQSNIFCSPCQLFPSRCIAAAMLII